MQFIDYYSIEVFIEVQIFHFTEEETEARDVS